MLAGTVHARTRLTAQARGPYRSRVWLRVAAVLPVLVIAATARAAIVPQQRGNACAAGWSIDGEAVPSERRRQPWTLDCLDGDPACDADGFANGVCRMSVSVCVAPAIEGCAPKPVRRLRLAPKTARLLPALTLPPLDEGSSCGSPTTFEVPVDPAEPTLLTLTSRSGSRRGASRVALRCRPSDVPNGVCPNRLPGRPAQATLAWRRQGSDVDFGWGFFHDYAFVDAVGPTLCLDGCDGTKDTDCGVTVPSEAWRPLPFPILQQSVTLCAVLRATAPASGSLDVSSGAMTLDLPLAADVFILRSASNICPRCTGDGTIGSTGTCQGGFPDAGSGGPCTVEALATVPHSNGSPVYQLSSDCLPGGEPVRSLPVTARLTTGEARLDGSLPCPGQTADDLCPTASACTVDCSAQEPPDGGLRQRCCIEVGGFGNASCFPTAPDAPPHAIVRTGLAPAFPATPFPRTARGVLAHVGCLGETTDATVDILAGLPGPTAWLLPFEVTVTAE